MSRVILAGCVAAKLPHPALARDLYVSPLWRKRRDYAERRVRRGDAIAWAIISAKFGLVFPDELVKPYDKRLGPRDVKPMGTLIQPRLIGWLLRLGALKMNGDHDDVVLELHAGAYYVQAVTEAIAHRPQGRLPITIEHPVAGLGIGEQQAWYDERRDEDDLIGPVNFGDDDQLEIGGGT